MWYNVFTIIIQGEGIMEKRNTEAFQKWLAKYRYTEIDIIKCRKMQSMSIMETENTFGISCV